MSEIKSVLSEIENTSFFALTSHTWRIEKEREEVNQRVIFTLMHPLSSPLAINLSDKP
jgi:hypothetical protein